MIRFNTSQNWILSSHLRDVLSIVLSVVSMIGMGVGFLGVEKSKYVTVQPRRLR